MIVSPLADPEPPERLAEEIRALPSDALLVRERCLAVFGVRASEAPAVTREIGRNRERTFREAGEGTGHVRDLDAYDEHYLQLVLWDEATCAVIGGYRVGFVDRLVPTGRLYTAQGFHYDEALLAELGEAIELGRSFVVPEHQRSFGPLLMLWKGIGAVLTRNERYRLLVGALSVSAELSDASRRDIATYLMSDAVRSPWSRHAAPVVPFDVSGHRPPADLRDLEARVLARDGRKPPVLVKPYLQLGMKGLACGIDPTFGDCLDILCVADLTEAPIALMRRYMGDADARAFVGRSRRGRVEAA